MNSRLGIACLLASAVASLIVGGCYHRGSTYVRPMPSPSPSGSPAPDTIYVQTTNKVRVYQGASAINGLAAAKEVLPTNDDSNPDVIYDPVSDTLWYPNAQGNTTNNPIQMWTAASTKNKMNSNVQVPFTFGEGAAAFDHFNTPHMLFVATTKGPQVSVYTSPETMTSLSVPAAVLTLAITDGASGATPRPQEMLYDNVNDRLYVSDQVTVVAVFDAFGTAAAAIVGGGPNNPIAPNRYLQGFFSPDGLAYSVSSDVLFVGEQLNKMGQINVVQAASTTNGPIGHTQTITNFSQPGGLAYDDVRNLLIVYDTGPIYVFPNGIAAHGNCCNGTIAGVHVIIDASAQGNDGFGLSLDTTH